MCRPERNAVGVESIYDTWQLVALVELGSKEQDPVIFQKKSKGGPQATFSCIAIEDGSLKNILIL